MIFFAPAILAALLISAGLCLLVPPIDFMSGARLILVHGVFAYGAVAFRFGGALAFALATGLLWDLSTMPIQDTPLASESLRPGWSIIYFGCAAAILNGARSIILLERRWELHGLATGVITLFHFTAEFIYITLARSADTPPEFAPGVFAKIGATSLLALLTAPLIYFSLTALEALCGSPVRRGLLPP